MVFGHLVTEALETPEVLCESAELGFVRGNHWCS